MNKSGEQREGRSRWMYLHRCWTLWTHHYYSVVTSGASNRGADHTYMHAQKKDLNSETEFVA